MKARLRKKLNKKAMQLMIEIGYAKEDQFSVEDGLHVIWYQCGSLEQEWDYMEAYEEIHRSAFDSLTVFDDELMELWQARDIKNAKDVFMLFKTSYLDVLDGARIVK